MYNTTFSCNKRVGTELYHPMIIIRQNHKGKNESKALYNMLSRRTLRKLNLKLESFFEKNK